MKNPAFRFVVMVASLVVVAWVGYLFGKRSSAPDGIEVVRLEQAFSAASVSADPRVEILKEIVVLESTSDRWQRSLEELEQESAPRMLSQLQALPNSPEKSAKLRSFFKRWGELDGPGALEAINSMRGRERLSMLSEAVAGWGRVDRAAAWEELMQASNDGRLFRPSMDAFVRGGVKEPTGLSPVPFLRELANRDLSQAFDFMDSIKTAGFGGKENFHAVLEVAAANGQYDALLAKVLESEDGQQTRLSDLFNVWGRYDLDAPLSALSSFENTNLAERAMGGLMRGWASVDGEEAFAYALENSDDPKMKKTLGDVARILAQSSTAAEIVVLFDEIEDPDQREKIASSVVGDIAKADPQSAFEWANSLADEKTRDKSLGRVLQTWAQSDFESAREIFLSDQVSDSVRDQSLFSIVMQSRGQPNSIEKSLELIGAVDSERARKNAISFIGSSINRGHFKSEEGMSKDDYISLIERSEILSENERETFLKSARGSKKKG